MSAEERPPGACVLQKTPREGQHWHPAVRGYLTCDGCLEHLREQLIEVVDRFLRLNPATDYSTAEERSAPGFASSPTANLHVVAMRDPRSSPTAKAWPGGDGVTYKESTHPPLSIWSVLNTCAWFIADAQGIDRVKAISVEDHARWIDAHLTWASSDPIIEEVGKRLREVLSQLRNVTEPRATIADCPNVLDDGTTCKAPLKAPLYGSTTITCGGCGRPWPRDSWDKLGQQIRAAR